MAEFARDYMPSELVKLQSYKSGDYQKALKEVFIKIDELLETPDGKSKLKTYCKVKGREGSDSIGYVAGATSCVALITSDSIICANAGDSRCVLSEKAKTIEMSEDHKPDLPTEKLRIEQAGYFVEEQRVNGILNLSRSLGDLEYKKNKDKGREL